MCVGGGSGLFIVYAIHDTVISKPAAAWTCRGPAWSAGGWQCLFFYQVLLTCNHDSCAATHTTQSLLLCPCRGALSRPELALVLLIELAYEHDEELRRHLPTLLHVITLNAGQSGLVFFPVLCDLGALLEKRAQLLDHLLCTHLFLYPPPPPVPAAAQTAGT